MDRVDGSRQDTLQTTFECPPCRRAVVMKNRKLRAVARLEVASDNRELTNDVIKCRPQVMNSISNLQAMFSRRDLRRNPKRNNVFAVRRFLSPYVMESSRGVR
jgi:hypothetical protein